LLEVNQRAGRRLMEGKDIVSISMPVEIFEKRSALERICDFWCTGTKYLPLAAKTVNSLLKLSD